MSQKYKMYSKAYLSLGSNLGDRKKNINVRNVKLYCGAVM